MDDVNSTDWWRWKMYRLISDYLYNPTDMNEASLKAILKDYRRFRKTQSRRFGDEHERVMDYI